MRFMDKDDSINKDEDDDEYDGKDYQKQYESVKVKRFVDEDGNKVMVRTTERTTKSRTTHYNTD